VTDDVEAASAGNGLNGAEPTEAVPSITEAVVHEEVPAVVPTGDAVLRLRELRVTFPTHFGDVMAVRGVDLDVGAGELVGIVGESGSGKSVTFLGLMGLLPRSARIEGSATVGGTELVGAPTKVINRVRGQRVAMIFQDPLSALNPVHRIGDQIVEMIQSHQKMSKKQAWERSVELLGVVGIPQPRDRASQYPHEFSGGMRQRVMIAMAIANDPEVLIADEPTTALDVTVQAQILDVLQRVRREMRTAIVLITHDLGVVARVADRVQVMYAGRAVERGDVGPIFDHPSHPYTRGLLSSLPALGTDRLSPIPGSPPNMLTPPSGCAFRTRCAHAVPACAEGLPELVPFGDLQTACIRAEELVVVGSRS
jgi:peptide/nickel transport system ATP-binding protein